MTNSRTVRRIILLSAFVIALFALPTVASAADKNHDKIPDKWEKRYKLSLHVKQTRRDQDHDGLKNLAEFKSGNNPRQDDSDGDGTEDGSENAGTITSFEDGVLTINLYNGGTISGLVTADTRIECHKAEVEDESGDDNSSARRQGPGSGSSEGEGSGDTTSDNSGPGESSGQGHGGMFGGHDGGQCSCSSDELTVGAVVEEAEVKLSDGDATFTEIELAEAAEETTTPAQ